MFNTKSLKKMGLITLLLSSLGVLAQADDVTDTIAEAVKSYEKGEYSTSLEDLNYAVELIKQKKSEGLQQYLPEPLEGWSAKDASSQTAGSGMFGGGVSAEREYKKDRSRVTIQIMADSPLLQSMLGIFSNPMFATSDGGKLERINRQKAIVKYDSDREKGDIKVIIAKRIMINIEGSKVSREELMAYAEAIDYKKIQDMF